MPANARTTALAQARVEMQQTRTRLQFVAAAIRAQANQLEGLLRRLDDMDWALFRAEVKESGSDSPPTQH